VGVAFFIWVGIFNMSLVAQFWSFANDIYNKDAGARLFPIIMIGMTAGAPLGAFTAARLFRLGMSPQAILQVSALLLAVSLVLYMVINRRTVAHGESAHEAPLAAGDGFRLVLGNRYLRLVALLVVLLNIVNTTGEYMVARLLTLHVKELAMIDASFNKQAFIGAFSGDYQFWVGVTAFLLQAFVTSRLIKYRGLAGVLLALPLIALGGYAIIAAGAGFTMVRWIKTAENATDYSIMNTARQLLWLPTTREEKYKAKQAIDTFFVRGGDVLSAGVVFVGTQVLDLSVAQFAIGNIALTLVWIGIALTLVGPFALPGLMPRRVMATAAMLALVLLPAATASAQDSRADQLAAERAAKATRLFEPTPDRLERRLAAINNLFSGERALSLHMGGPIEGSGIALGPGYRKPFGDTGLFTAHATYSLRNYKAAEARLALPRMANDKLAIDVHGQWFNAPTVAFYGVGNDTERADRRSYLLGSTNAGASATFQLARPVSVGTSFDVNGYEADLVPGIETKTATTNYRRAGAFFSVDTRTSPGYTRKGALYKVELSDYRGANAAGASFQRVDAEVQQVVPLLRENWVLAFRAAASTTTGENVPYFLMPDLGGSHELRGYPAFRFKDRHRMLLTGEYRWTAGPLLDMALFVDAGKVASNRADLNFDDLKFSHGIGMRIHTPAATITRIEVARSVEGTRLIVAFSPSF
jgi:ATP:ADP antiporter, AAA family